MPPRCRRSRTFGCTAGALAAALVATISSRSATASVSVISRHRLRLTACCNYAGIRVGGTPRHASGRAATTRAAYGKIGRAAHQARPIARDASSSHSRLELTQLSRLVGATYAATCAALAAMLLATSAVHFRWLSPPWSTSTVVVEASSTTSGRIHEAQKIIRAKRETRTGAPLQDLASIVDAMETNGDKAFVIGRLLDELTASETVDRAMPVAKLVWQAWMFHENPIVAKLMKDGTACLAVGELQEAEWRFVNAIHFDPSYAEAWNKLATVHYLSNDLEASLSEIQQTLDLEPSHFGALSGKGLVLLKMDCFAEAAEAMRQAQDVFPMAQSLQGDIEFAEALDREFGSADVPAAAL